MGFPLAGALGRAPKPEGDRQRDWRQALEPIPAAIRWYMKHPAAGTLLLGVYLVVKGFVLSKGDIPIALGILHTAGLVSVAIGGLLSALPILAAAMLAVSVCRVIKNWQPPAGTALLAALGQESFGKYLRDSIPARAVVTGGAAVLCAVLTPWTFMASAIAIGILQGITEVWREPTAKSGHKPPKLGKVPLTIVCGMRPLIGIIAVYAIMVMLYTVWMPHESVHLSSGPQPRREVGYVLAEDPGGWITILRSGEHRIVWYPDSQVTSQVLCELVRHGLWSQVANASTLWDLVTDAPVLHFLHPASMSACTPGRSGPPPQG